MSKGWKLVCEDCGREVAREKAWLLEMSGPDHPGPSNRYVCPKCADRGIAEGRYLHCGGCAGLFPAARRSKDVPEECEDCGRRDVPQKYRGE
jgi:hypothetical protein